MSAQSVSINVLELGWSHISGLSKMHVVLSGFGGRIQLNGEDLTELVLKFPQGN